MLTNKKNITTVDEKKYLFFKEEGNKLLIPPFQALAYFTAIAGIVALILEVRYFAQYSVIVYLSRFSATGIAFLLLTLSYTKFGKKHIVLLVHILLLSIISSFGVIIFLIPKTLIFNSHIISLIIFTAALFLSWEVTNQIIVAIYYNVVFAASIIFNDKGIYILPNMMESVILVVIISIMAIVASYINYKLRQEATWKSFEILLSEKKFRNIFENSAEGIFQYAANGKFLTVNPAMIKMLGYGTEEELMKLNIASDVFKRKGDLDLLNKLLEKQGKVRNYRVVLVKKDKTEIIVRMNVRLGDQDSDKIEYFEGSIQDITQQVQAENDRQTALEALRQEKLKAEIAAKKAQQESSFKSRFLANMSHEVRTPMNSVMGFLTLIENDLFEDKDELKNFAADARLAAESLLDIINNILDISKIEAGKMELDEDEVDIRAEVNKSVSILSQHAKVKGIELGYSIEESIPETLYSDATRYRQIIVNLLANAIKFTDEGKVTVNVKVKSEAGNVFEILTEVEDTGIGIPADKIPLLFEPYSQLKNKKSTKEGTGLGLVISKEFVKLMGGDINVESKLGVGSKFSFTTKMKLQRGGEPIMKLSELPEMTQAVPEVKEETEVKPKIEIKKKLLLVEDNPISQNLELKILREVGYEVEAVSNGYDAVDAVKTGIFDLVLMDVEMTDLDGIAATKKIRELEGSVSRVPVIAVTAHSSMKDREKCLAGGMDDYIAKPINIHFLKITIDQWLNTSR